MSYRNHRAPFGFKQELGKVARDFRRRAGEFRGQITRAAALHGNQSPTNPELQAMRLKIARTYDDLAEIIDNRLFKEW
jgi:hypothetical protein